MQVLAVTGIVPKSRLQELKQGREFRPGPLDLSVENTKAFATRGHQTGVFEIVEMPGDVGLREIEHVLDVAAAQLAIEQEIEDAQTIGIGEAFEAGLEPSGRQHQLMSLTS